MNYTRKHTTSI